MTINNPKIMYPVSRQKPLTFLFLLHFLHSSRDFELDINIFQLLQEQCGVYYKCRGVK